MRLMKSYLSENIEKQLHDALSKFAPTLSYLEINDALVKQVIIDDEDKKVLDDLHLKIVDDFGE